MIRALGHCERGNSFIELALIAPIIVGLVIGMVDVSRGVSEKLKAVQAAQRTVELVQRSGFTYGGIADLETEAEAAAGDGATAIVTAWLECGTSTTREDYSGNCSSGEPYSRHMDVTITKTFTPLFGTKYFPGANADGTYTISAVAGVRTQ